MKTRKITKTTISNDVIIEQLQNGRCVLARGIDIPYQYCWQLEEPMLSVEQQKVLEEYHNIINNISEWKLVVNDIMIKSNKNGTKLNMK